MAKTKSPTDFNLAAACQKVLDGLLNGGIATDIVEVSLCSRTSVLQSHSLVSNPQREVVLKLKTDKTHSTVLNEYMSIGALGTAIDILTSMVVHAVYWDSEKPAISAYLGYELLQNIPIGEDIYFKCVIIDNLDSNGIPTSPLAPTFCVVYNKDNEILAKGDHTKYRPGYKDQLKLNN